MLSPTTRRRVIPTSLVMTGALAAGALGAVVPAQASPSAPTTMVSPSMATEAPRRSPDEGFDTESIASSGKVGMAKAIFTLKSGLKVGRVALGAHGDVPGSVRQQTHDGDTVIVDPDGNLGVRFLGVDAPEVSFTLPGSTRPARRLSSISARPIPREPRCCHISLRASAHAAV